MRRREVLGDRPQRRGGLRVRDPAGLAVSGAASGAAELPEGSDDDPPSAETIHGLGTRKNEILLRRIRTDGVEAYDSSVRYVHAVRDAGLRAAVVSSSANCRDILHAVGIEDLRAGRQLEHDIGAGQRVEQSALSDVRVSDEDEIVARFGDLRGRRDRAGFGREQSRFPGFHVVSVGGDGSAPLMQLNQPAGGLRKTAKAPD